MHAWPVLISMLDRLHFGFYGTARCLDMSTQNCQDINTYDVDLQPVMIIFVAEGGGGRMTMHPILYYRHEFR